VFNGTLYARAQLSPVRTAHTDRKRLPAGVKHHAERPEFAATRERADAREIQEIRDATEAFKAAVEAATSRREGVRTKCSDVV
jgi:hypothetical protein